ncbi:hypothetical protein A1O7_04186 [Cladophialophora yegresii CBS 114405]|uniref:ATPase n=1 Tax=Cladophialophora yegresii CBS 114405 TaxID=1182544 RepID=W9VW21_9EURO|nr:uncharacterized protein A1O7_04186 [Cladophialophora yegresii CBS 114405]EXJ60037.1 hypothetical protein A1O7_04186 [Cladophialophora yegresii CBS 114405]
MRLRGEKAPIAKAEAVGPAVVEAAPIAVKEDGKSDKPATATFSDYWRVLSYRSRRDGYALLVSSVCALASGAVFPLMNIIFGHLAQNFNDYFLPNSTTKESSFKAAVNKFSLYFFLLFIGRFVLTYISTFGFRITGLRISARLRLSYFESLFSQPIAAVDEISSGAVATTITDAANTIQMSISDKLYFLFYAIALVISAYTIAFRYSWSVTLVASCSLLFVVVVYSITTPFILKKQTRVLEANKKASSTAGEVFGSIRAVFSLGAQKNLTNKYFAAVEDARKCGLAVSIPYGIQLAPIFFSMYASFGLVFWFGIKQYRAGHIDSIGTLVTVFFSVLIVVMLLGILAAPVIAIQKAIPAAGQFFSTIDAPRISYGGLSDPDVSSQEDIELDDVTFAYPTRPDVQVLKGFTARFLKGKTTALVGPSGSGKSTIVALLERWYELDPTDQEDDVGASDAERSDVEKGKKQRNRGEIRMGISAIRSINLKWWRSQIGLVQQEPFLFNDTIFNNVAFGLNGTQWEEADTSKKHDLVRKACEEAFADEFIRKLPDGYETEVGESGIKLSGGQRQRLAIARSIIRDPAILILDEATSSIDVRGERIVQKALDRVSRDRTTIVIAHRLSTIRKADNIIVMREGRKMEEGTHEHLLSVPNGLYAGLVHAQQLEAESAPAVPREDEVALDDLERKFTTKSADGPGNETKVQKKRGFAASVGCLLYEQRRYWMLYTVILIAAMATGSAASLQSWFFANVMVVFTYTGQKLEDRGNFWALMFFVLSLALALTYFLLGSFANHLSVLVMAVYQREHFQNLLRFPVSYFDAKENATGSLMARLASDFKILGELIGINGVFPLIALFNLTGCIIIGFVFGWKLTLVIFCSAMPVMLVSSFIRIKYELQFVEWNSNVFAQSSQFATEAVGAFRTVTSLTMEEFILNKYSTLLQRQIRDATRQGTHACLIFALCDTVDLCAMALTFWYGGQLLASREYDILQFYLIYIAIVQGAQGAGPFLSFAPNIAQATAAANRILDSRVSGNEATLASVPISLPQREEKMGARVELKEVSFKYPTRDTLIYRNLDLVVQSSQFVAFVGPSGCGKTTIVSLLERFYEPVSGTIKFDDHDLKDIELTSYRRALSLVAQEPKLFDGTIRENLILGVDDEDIPEERIIQACRDAEIHDFVISLPGGYDTPLGINTQTSLSGGQKQRLCLARALLRQPSLLLLDEATSSLDSQSEKLVQAAIEKLVAQRSMTVIAVAHRLATIQKADVIFVFGESEAGRGSRILEKGTHSELLGRRGAYWSMCQEQALDR